LIIPVGCGPLALVTVALSVIDSPTVGIASVVLSAVVVDDWAMVSFTAFDVPDALFVSPP
jgi:hypothetical protein